MSMNWNQNPNTGDWRKRVATSGLVAGAGALGGLVTHNLYGQDAQLIEIVAGGAAGVGAFKLLFQRADGHGFAEGLGTSAGWAATFLAEAGVAGWSGGGSQSLWAALGAGAMNVAWSFAWYEHWMERWLDRNHRMTQINNAGGSQRLLELREEMALLKLKQQYEKVAPKVETDPEFERGLPGAIQRALWNKYKKLVEIAEFEVIPANEKGLGEGWRAEVELPLELGLEEVQKAAGVIGRAGRLRRAPVVSPAGVEGVVAVEYRAPGSLPSLVPYEPQGPVAWNAPILIGLDEYEDPILLDPLVHTLIAGTTGGGKSTMLRLLTLSLTQRECSQVLFIDLKEGIEANLLEPILDGTASDEPGARGVLEWLLKEVEERAEILKARKADKWDPTVDGRPVVWAIVDEFTQLSEWDKVNKKTKGEMTNVAMLFDLLRRARAVGIFLILATQTPDKSAFGGTTSARGQLNNRIGFRMQKNHAGMVFDDLELMKPNKLGKHGEFLLQTLEGTHPAAMRGIYVDAENDLPREIERIAEWRGGARATVTKSDRISFEKMQEVAEEVSRLTRSQAAEAIMLELAMGPATKGGLKGSLGETVNSSTIKNALWKLKQEGKVEYDQESELWRLV